MPIVYFSAASNNTAIDFWHCQQINYLENDVAHYRHKTAKIERKNLSMIYAIMNLNRIDRSHDVRAIFAELQPWR